MEMALGHLALLLVLKQLRFLVDIKSLLAWNVVTDKFKRGTPVVMMLVFILLQLRQLRFLLIMHIPLILVPFIMEI